MGLRGGAGFTRDRTPARAEVGDDKAREITGEPEPGAFALGDAVGVDMRFQTDREPHGLRF